MEFIYVKDFFVNLPDGAVFKLRLESEEVWKKLGERTMVSGSTVATGDQRYTQVWVKEVIS